MSLVPMQSRTEVIVDSDSGFMEFDLREEWGFTEFRGMLAELGVKATLFNGYMVQPGGGEVNMSTSTIQLHAFSHAIYVAPPFDTQEYYFEIPKPLAIQAKVYFRIPPLMKTSNLDGYKPRLEEMSAIDLWVERIASTGRSEQMIYTFFYEAKIKTEVAEYEITRFKPEQLVSDRYQTSGHSH